MSKSSSVQKTKCPKDQMSKSPSVQKAKSHEIKSLKNKGQKVQVSKRPNVKKAKCLEVHLYQRPNVQKSKYPKDQMSTRPHVSVFIYCLKVLSNIVIQHTKQRCQMVHATFLLDFIKSQSWVFFVTGTKERFNQTIII